MSETIDAHLHLYQPGFWPGRWFDHVAERWALGAADRTAEAIRGRIEEGMADEDGSRMLAHLDAAGMQKGVLLALDWELGMNYPAGLDIREINRRHGHIASRSAGRLEYFAGVDPRRPDALEILTEAVRDHGARGLKLYPPAGFYPYDDCVRPLYSFCQENSLPILIHSGSTVPLLRPRFANPIFLQDVQADFSGLIIWIGHAGGRWWWDEAVTVARNGFSTYLEISNWDDFAYRHSDTFVRMVCEARALLGPEKLLFGSDHISGSRFRGVEGLLRWTAWIRTVPARAEALGLQFSETDLELLLGGNAARCLAGTVPAAP